MAEIPLEADADGKGEEVDEDRPTVDGDRPVTERICALKRKDNEALTKSITELQRTFEKFVSNDFHELSQKVTGFQTEVTGLCSWKESHEKQHDKKPKIYSVIAQMGSWIMAIVMALLYLLTVTGVIGKPTP